MSAIGPGDWVEFVGVDDGHAPYPGQLYQISSMDPDNSPDLTCECGSWIGVELAGIPEDPDSCWCTGCELRPIYRPKQELIESLKAPGRTKEPA